eukprot:Lithocolla_globosa_v1_NODE_1090_length_2879_cov_37.449912.p1 type:complete len:302 gc:universal NODE_1090_length_2879_cov_37.449912:1362-2267(+)
MLRKQTGSDITVDIGSCPIVEACRSSKASYHAYTHYIVRNTVTGDCRRLSYSVGTAEMIKMRIAQKLLGDGDKFLVHRKNKIGKRTKGLVMDTSIPHDRCEFRTPFSSKFKGDRKLEPIKPSEFEHLGPLYDYDELGISLGGRMEILRDTAFHIPPSKACKLPSEAFFLICELKDIQLRCENNIVLEHKMYVAPVTSHRPVRRVALDVHPPHLLLPFCPYNGNYSYTNPLYRSVKGDFDEGKMAGIDPLYLESWRSLERYVRKGTDKQAGFAYGCMPTGKPGMMFFHRDTAVVVHRLIVLG